MIFEWGISRKLEEVALLDIFFCSDSFETIQEVETKIEEIYVMVTKVSYLRVHWRHVKGRKRIFI